MPYTPIFCRAINSRDLEVRLYEHECIRHSSPTTDYIHMPCAWSLDGIFEIDKFDAQVVAGHMRYLGENNEYKFFSQQYPL